MALFEWDEIYRTGIASIDEQHQRLFAIANRLHDAWQEGAPRPCGAVHGLRRTAGLHGLPLRGRGATHDGARGYPGLARHRGYHDKLAGLVHGYHPRLRARETGIEPRILEFLRLWLNAHVLGTHKEIAAYQHSVQVHGGLWPPSMPA